MICCNVLKGPSDFSCLHKVCIGMQEYQVVAEKWLGFGCI